MMRLCSILLLLATPATAQVQSALGAGDPRLQTIPYDTNQVFRLRVAARYQLTLIFGPDERVENVAIGDSDAWQTSLNGRRDALFVKPVDASGTTNMTVITDARVYSFELTSTQSPTADTPFTVRFSYPATIAEQPPVAPAEVGRYRLSGSRSLRPQSISDDGAHTYIEWRPRQNLPAVFAVDDNGQELLVDGYVRDGRYVIDAVHPTLLFRRDGQTARANRVRLRTRE